MSLWDGFTNSTPHFARIFHTGFGLIITAFYAIQFDSRKESVKEEESEVRNNIEAYWFFSFLFFLATFCLKTYYNIVHRKVRSPRHRRLTDLRIGVVGLLICAFGEVIFCFFKKYDDGSGYIFIGFAHTVTMIIMGLFVMEQSHMCKIPEKHRMFHLSICLMAGVVGCYLYGTAGQNASVRSVYIPIIECLLADGYILFFRPSEIHFLGDFLGKCVICKDKEGNEYRGNLVSVDFEYRKFWLRVKLENVERMIDGRFFEEPEHVYINEIESLELEDVKSIEKY